MTADGFAGLRALLVPEKNGGLTAAAPPWPGSNSPAAGPCSGRPDRIPRRVEARP